MMYCLRRYNISPEDLTSTQTLTFHSYLPLLLLPLPLSLSPIHLTVLLVITYILHRPCIYCSLLLIILFASSCHWSNRCFIDFGYKTPEEGGYGIAGWFLPRVYTTGNSTAMIQHASNITLAEYVGNVTNQTVSSLAAAALEGLKNKILPGPGPLALHLPDTDGIGTQWLKSLLGRSEWILPCLNVKVAI